MIDYVMIGSRIREERKHSRMNLEQMAKALGVTIGYLSQLERGLKNISLDMIGEISALFGVDPAYFVSGTVMVSGGARGIETMAGYGKLCDRDKLLIDEMIRTMLEN